MIKNRLTAIGNIGKIESNDTTTGKKVTRISLAQNEKWTDKQTGETKERTTWLYLTAFGSLAEMLDKHAVKGQQIAIEATLRNNSYQPEGNSKPVSGYDLIIEEVQFLGKKATDSAHADTDTTHYSTGNVPAGELPDDGIPF